jgi:endogenous inhibitor of DNA gyrase (YacG/DUF329 family)
MFDSEIPAFIGAITWLFGWMCIWVCILLRMSTLRCPRCGQRFFIGKWHGLPLSNPFARRCAHCDLPKWAESEHKEDSAAAR